jgi:hypothetical protein
VRVIVRADRRVGAHRYEALNYLEID